MTYIATINADDLFADNTYQRPTDPKRTKKIAATWDRRLVGVIEVSDRGPHTTPRYAVIDGQHRWAAATLLTPPPPLVANIHENLTTAEEAALFDKLNRQRKATNTWDHWKARRAAGDQTVTRIQQICNHHHLVIDMAAQNGVISCVATIEKIAHMGGVDAGCDLLDETLELVTEIWERRRDSLDAPIICGTALVLRYLRNDIDLERLTDALMETTPKRINAEASRIGEETRGTLATRTALAITARYNRTPGKKILVTAKHFGGGSLNARSPRAPRFVEKYSELTELGFTYHEIAKKLDINLCSLVRQLERYSLPVKADLASAAVRERNNRRRSA